MATFQTSFAFCRVTAAVMSITVLAIVVAACGGTAKSGLSSEDVVAIALRHGFELHKWRQPTAAETGLPGLPDSSAANRDIAVLVLDNRDPTEVATSPLTVIVMEPEFPLEEFVRTSGFIATWRTMTAHERSEALPAGWDVGSFTELIACNVVLESYQGARDRVEALASDLRSRCTSEGT